MTDGKQHTGPHARKLFSTESRLVEGLWEQDVIHNSRPVSYLQDSWDGGRVTSTSGTHSLPLYGVDGTGLTSWLV